MRDKRTIFSLFFLLHFSVYSQVNYLTTGIGFSLPFDTQTVFIQESGNVGALTQKAVASSYGKGISLSLSYNRKTKYAFNWGVELKYLEGLNIKVREDVYARGGSTGHLDWKSKGRGLFLSPYIQKYILNSDGRKVYPYALFGMVIGNPTVVDKYSIGIFNAYRPGQSIKIEDRLTHNLAVGFRSTIGIDIQKDYNDNSFFIELGFTVINPWRREIELTRYINVDEDVLKDLEKTERIAHFSRSVSNASGEFFSNTTPFGSFDIRFGMKFKIGKE